MRKVISIITTVFVYLLINSSVNAQIITGAYDVNKDNRTAKEYGRMVVDSITQYYYHGRGYLHEGDMYGALFVASEMLRFNMKRFKSCPTFYQNFNMSVNVFPEDVFVALDDRFLTCGVDFVPSAHSGTAQGTYDLVWLDSTTVLSDKEFKNFARRDFSNTFIVIDDLGVKDEEMKKLFQNMRKNPYGAKGIVHIKDRILWTVATESVNYASVDIVRGKITKSDKSIRVQILNAFEPNYNTRNVIAYIEGKEVPDTFIIVSAHYDHLGQIGRYVYFPGANDNASGVAMMLSIARHFAKKENQPKYSIAFIGFGAEEAGLIGSRKYVFAPIIPLEKTKFLLNLDIMGTGEEGITVVNATEFEKEFNLLEQINSENGYLSQIKKRGPAANSDHYFFYEKGVRCFFAYTMGGIKAYHDIYDRAETLSLSEFEDLNKLFVEFIENL